MRAIAFFGAAAAPPPRQKRRSLSLREAYDAIEWPILILFAALIPVSDTLRATGGTELIASWPRRHARRHCRRSACARACHGRRDGGDAVPQQRRDGAGHGADRGEPRARSCDLNPDPFLMAVAVGAGMRLPDPDRASMQHAGDGSGRLQILRLLAAWAAAVVDRARRRYTADCLFLAALIGVRLLLALSRRSTERHRQGAGSGHEKRTKSFGAGMSANDPKRTT